MVNLVKPIFAYSTPATADMWSIPEGKAYSVDVPGIYRKFVVHTGAGTTIVTGTMWYNSPAELSEAGYVTSMRSDGCLMITFFDEATVQATGRFLSDKSYEVIDTLIEAGSWKSTPQPERPYPNITPAVADLDHTSGWISIYSISAPLIQKKFTKKAGTGKLITGTLMYTSPADLEGEQGADTKILDDKLVLSFVNASGPGQAEFRSTDNFNQSTRTLNVGIWEEE